MSTDWHEQIQRCMAGDATPEEIAALQQALKDDAELRALYLDYLNLDMALGTAAEMAALAGSGTSRTTPFPPPAARLSPPHWRWLAATAACAALVLFAVLPRHRNPSRAQPDIAAVAASTQAAISHLHTEIPPALPEWISPTASMLDQPHFHTP